MATLSKRVFVKDKGESLEVGKIVCVGRNYVAHAKELGNEVPPFPLIFLKPASVMIKSGGTLFHPPYSENLHYEAELVLLITKTIKNADISESEAAIGGYAVGLDMTLRDIQDELKAKGHPWTLAKVFDGSAVVGDFLSTETFVPSFEERIVLKLNSEIRQDSRLKNMIFKPVEIVRYISSKMTLEAGDLIFTGTPAGVGKAIPGDVIEAYVDNLPKIEVRIESETNQV